MKFETIIGDALQVLKEMETASVHGVLMDPPYCSGGFSESGKKQAKGQGLRSETIRDQGWFVNDNMSTAGLIWLLRNVLIELERIVKPGGNILVFTDWRMVVHLAPALESSGVQFRNLIVWDKGSMGLGNGFRPQHEIILHFAKNSPNFFAKNVGNVVRCKRVVPKNKTHQTENPVELLGKLIKVIAEPGQTILDPFCGSGSTGEACYKLGVNFIGIDKMGIHVKTAEKRGRAAKRADQTALFKIKDK